MTGNFDKRKVMNLTNQLICQHLILLKLMNVDPSNFPSVKISYHVALVVSPFPHVKVQTMTTSTTVKASELIVNNTAVRKAVVAREKNTGDYS